MLRPASERLFLPACLSGPLVMWGLGALLCSVLSPPQELPRGAAGPTLPASLSHSHLPPPQCWTHTRTHTDVSCSGPSPLGATRTLCFPPLPPPASLLSISPSTPPHSSPCPLSLEIAVLLTAWLEFTALWEVTGEGHCQVCVCVCTYVCRCFFLC